MKTFTLVIEPGGTYRRAAGPYNQATRTPLYEADVVAPDIDVKRQVQIESELMGSDGNCSWIWKCKNNSNWPVQLVLKVDGIIQL
jgi:hypothetical protein